MIAFIFDTETTGLVKNSLVPIARQPRIIEFFGHLVDLRTGSVLEELEFLANPNQSLGPIITRITGLTDKDLRDKPPFSVNAGRVKRIIEQAESAIAHNLSFDRAVVDYEMLRAETPLDWPSRMLCTVEQTEWRKSQRMSLTMLHEYLFGEGFKDAHRARNDVEALTRCAVELFKRGWL